VGELVRQSADSRIAVVVVTYGDRLAFLEPVLQSALAQPCVARLIVADNGSPDAVARRLDALGSADDRIAIIRHHENLGSAGGFRTGVQAAASSTCRFVWLLDDDTRPETGAAEALLDAWARLAAEGPAGVRALISQRWVEDRYRRENAWNVNAAFGVDVLDRMRGQRARGRSEGGVTPILVRMAPWSGLFFERALIDELGLPDDRLVLYEDDHEFTLRLSAGRDAIMVVPKSRLVTLDPSWHEDDAGGLSTPWLSAPDARRIYYGARNRVYVERLRLVTNPVRHALNLAAFVVRVAGSALGASHRRRNLRWFLTGIADGWRGRLGPRALPTQEN
jgi:GT2 family glycosyltransferase